MTRALLLSLAALPLSLLAAAACGDDEAGTGGGTATGAGTGTGTGSTAGAGGMGGATSDGGGGAGGVGGSTMGCDDLACNDCSACAEADPCMAESAACNGNDVCGDYASCVNGCGSDVTCLDGCKTTHADGVDDFDALISCICTTCATSCGSNPLCPPMM